MTEIPKGLGDTLLAWASDPNHRPVAVALVVDEANDASVSITWGYEADDSPMAGAQALGAGDTLAEALTEALGEAGVQPCGRCGFELRCLAETGDPCHS